eukprot:Em0448g2a
MAVPIVVVGSCMVDLVSYVPRLPKPGETIHGTQFIKGFGGKGANQCVMAARLGAKTAMVAKLGNDTFGHSTVQNFHDNNIDCDYVTLTSEVSSGVAAITVNEQGENSIVIVSGANSLLSPADVEHATDVICGAKVLICQLEVPMETSLVALQMGRQYKATTILNAAPGKVLLQEVYDSVDILCVNETEAEILTGMVVLGLEQGRVAVEAMRAKGPPRVVLTMGEQGVLYSDGASVKHVPAMKVDVVDTTGAGDAFVGAMAFYLACHPHLSFDEVIKRSAVIASTTVTAKGTQSSYCVSKVPQEYLMK